MKYMADQKKKAVHPNHLFFREVDENKSLRLSLKKNFFLYHKGRLDDKFNHLNELFENFGRFNLHLNRKLFLHTIWMACISDRQDRLLQGSFALAQTCDSPIQNRSNRYAACADLLMSNFGFYLCISSLPGFSDTRELNSYRDPFD